MLIFMPIDLALGGSCVRKSRAGLAHVEKGLNLAVTSVMYLVIILAVAGPLQGAGIGERR